MRNIILVLFVTMFSVAGISQNNGVIKKNNSGLLSKTSNFNSERIILNYPLKFSENFPVIRNPARFTLYHDSTFSKVILYDNYRGVYFYDPLRPCNNFKSAVLYGTLNTLAGLINKKK